jgi:4-carboxymuconolactone decarboxylase
MGWNFDIDARMDETVHRGQRIDQIREEDMTPEQRQTASDLRKAFGIPEDGYIPEVLLLMLRHPDLFKAQIEMGIALVGKGTIPPREREIAILRNAWLLGAPYEWGEHVDLGKRAGMTPEEIERCTVGSAAEGWSDHDRAIVRGVEELHDNYALSNETWDELAKSWNEVQLLEFPALVGQYVATAFQQNTLRVKLMGDNPGLSHR